jgi:hypothetical protein
MISSNEAQKRIEEYLDTLRDRLRGVTERDAQDFVEELRSHIQDKISATGEMTPSALERVLTGLGNPEELAREFNTNILLTGTEGIQSPTRIIRILFGWARFSFAGLFTLAGAAAGYFVGSVLFICALLKPFHPHTAGLWAFRDPTGDLNLSLRMGAGSPPDAAHELLGWWIVPIGLLAAIGLVLATSRLALWSARKFRRSNVCRLEG